MQLLEEDELYLKEKEYDYEAIERGSELHLVIRKFPMPGAYAPQSVELLIRLPAGYPNAKPDMFWTTPRVSLANGQCPLAAEVNEVYGGTAWQRWSRHWNAKWRPGVDGLETFLGSIRNELQKGI
jgi:Prokaryotic E2 family E